MREKPLFPAQSRVSRRAWPYAGMPGWSERIRTHAFQIEPGLCASIREFGNMAGSTAPPVQQFRLGKPPAS
jgi:hypothetical protein